MLLTLVIVFATIMTPLFYLLGYAQGKHRAVDEAIKLLDQQDENC